MGSLSPGRPCPPGTDPSVGCLRLPQPQPGIAFMADDGEVIKVNAKKFEYSLAEITLKKGAPVIIEFTPGTGSMGSTVSA